MRPDPAAIPGSVAAAGGGARQEGSGASAPHVPNPLLPAEAMTTSTLVPSVKDHPIARSRRAPTPAASGASRARRAATGAAGGLVYLLFLATFLTVMGFVTGLVVPRTIDGGRAAALGTALAVNGGLLGLFALQHTIMARISFKRRWTRIVPVELERSTFVLVTCAILWLLVWQWRALPAVVWHVEGPAAALLWAVGALGWGTVLYATFLIDHFELFGLRQTLSFALGRPHRPARFQERSLYKLVRHPLMLGFLLAFWSTPHMSQGHLLFALLVTGYILFGVAIEERTLVALHGADYLDYRRRVPKLLPWPRKVG